MIKLFKHCRNEFIDTRMTSFGLCTQADRNSPCFSLISIQNPKKFVIPPPYNLMLLDKVLNFSTRLEFGHKAFF